MNEPIYILYVDSDPLSATQLVQHFNPPKFMSAQLSQLSDKPARKNAKEPKHKFVFIHCPTYRKALQILLSRNGDPHPLAKKKAKPPIYTIFFEVNRKIKTSTEKYNWLNFLQDIHQLGIHRLNLNNGFLAFGYQASDAFMEQLMFYGVRKFLKKPFSMEDLNTVLDSYVNTNRGSSTFYIDERKEESEPGKLVTRRSARYYDLNGKLGSVDLPYIEEERDGNTIFIWLRNIEEEEAETDEVGFGESVQDEVIKENQSEVLEAEITSTE
jgi:hypothetical protein